MRIEHVDSDITCSVSESESNTTAQLYHSSDEAARARGQLFSSSWLLIKELLWCDCGEWIICSSAATQYYNAADCIL
jgi:hypothetical protein